MIKNIGKFVVPLVLVTFFMASMSVFANEFESENLVIDTSSAEVAPEADIAMIAAGYFHTCALKNGAVFCWGSNAGGQLGTRDSSVTQSNLPVKAMSNGIKEISAGGAHTCALHDLGTVYCWGSNFDGQTGSPITVTNIYTPTIVEGFFNVDSISAGTDHTCAIKDGGAKCWGANDSGQLGDGEEVNSGSVNNKTHIPTDVIGMSSGVTQISAGNGHTCAVQNGGAKCWGDNGTGQLGPGFATNPYGLSTPQDVVGLESGVSQVSAGTSQSCAVTTGGGAKCWGANNSGQGGNGTTSSNLIASDVFGLTSGVEEIVAAGSHSCARITNGTVQCWGGNNGGYLGDGTFTQRNSPVSVFGIQGGVTSLSAPGFSSHTCAVAYSMPICWGSNTYGELGNNTNTDSPYIVLLHLEPVSIAPLKNFTDGSADTIKGTNNSFLKWKKAPLVQFYEIQEMVNQGDWTFVEYVSADELRQQRIFKNLQASMTCYRIRSHIGLLSNNPATFLGSSEWSQPSCLKLNAETQYIDLSISLYWPSLAEGENGTDIYESIIDHFADAIYEMSNGAHQVRNVYFILDSGYKHDADVMWNYEEWPRAHPNGYFYRNGRLWMADVWPFLSGDLIAIEPENHKKAGYTLGHEFGHYYYGLFDEYVVGQQINDRYKIPSNNPYSFKDDLYVAKAGYSVIKNGNDWEIIADGQTTGVKITPYPAYTPKETDNYTIRDDRYEANAGYRVEKVGADWKWFYADDVPVPNSAMNSQHVAANTGDLSWLNFSTVLNNHTATNNQFRTYNASAWDTLTREPKFDPKTVRTPFKRVYMPELVNAETPPSIIEGLIPFYWPSSPKIDLPNAKSRELVNVVWIGNLVTRGPDTAEDDSDFTAIIESVDGNSFVYPEPILLVAQLQRDNPVALATLTTTVTKPDGTQITVDLKDDGQFPDELPEDGLYTGYLDYDQDGEYVVDILFDNQNGEAGETNSGVASASPEGDTMPIFFDVIETEFSEQSFTTVEVSGYTADDHQNSTSGATNTLADNSDIPGRIDYAGDIDVFEITPTETSKLKLSLYQLGLDMAADIRIYEADGSTLIISDTFSLEDGDVFETMLDVSKDLPVFVEVRHQSSAATAGQFMISAKQLYTTTTLLSVSSGSSEEGETVTLTAEVSATIAAPSGVVRFYDGDVQLGVVSLSDGVAEITTSSLSAGDHVLRAEYDGDLDYILSRSNSVEHTVNAGAGGDTLIFLPMLRR